MLPESLLWFLTLGLILLGLVGTLLPFLPGPFLIVIATFIHLFPQVTTKPLGWVEFTVIFGLFFITLLVDYFFGFVGARFGGISRAGFVMGIFGMIVGIFSAPWGIILGPLAGVFLGEILVAKRAAPEALRATAGYALGNLAGIVVKLALTLAMAAYLLWVLWKGSAA